MGHEISLNDRIIKMYTDGYTCKEVANYFGFKHGASIGRLIKKHGKMRTLRESALLSISKGRKGKAIAALILSAKTTNRFNPLKNHGKGQNSPHWIKDRSKLKNKRSFFEEKEFFTQIMRERGYVCQITGLHGTLSVHHIKGVWNHKELMFNKDNCIVILRSIHMKFHRIYGKRTDDNDWKQFIEKEEYKGCVKETKKKEYAPFEDKTGFRYGRLVVLFKNGKKWRCKCDCGNELDAEGSNLKNGRTKSCGCLRSDVNKEKMTTNRVWDYRLKYKEDAGFRRVHLERREFELKQIA